MENSIFNLWTYFIIYSIAGWILESIFRSMCEKKIVNTGFLNGPFCPIYGIGSIIMILFLQKFNDNIIALFVISFISMSIWEYIVGVCLELIFKTRYWDYSDHKININGRICLSNSIYWGILGTLFIKCIHPFVVSYLVNINEIVLIYIIYFITIVFVIDTIVSVVNIKNIKVTLEKIEKLNYQIKEKIDELKKIKTKKSKNDTLVTMQNTVEELDKKKNRILNSLYRRVYRLKEAFPAIETKEITEILSKKIDFKKKENKDAKEKK